MYRGSGATGQRDRAPYISLSHTLYCPLSFQVHWASCVTEASFVLLLPPSLIFFLFYLFSQRNTWQGQPEAWRHVGFRRKEQCDWMPCSTGTFLFWRGAVLRNQRKSGTADGVCHRGVELHGVWCSGTAVMGSAVRGVAEDR